MTKRMLIDATHAEETRVVVLDGNRLEDFDVETSTKRQLKGNIYLAKVVRVEPSLQAAFVEYGGGRHGFLAFGEIHPDYYQIPVADRQRLLEMQAEDARREEEEEDRAAAAEEAGQTISANVREIEISDAEPETIEHGVHEAPKTAGPFLGETFTGEDETDGEITEFHPEAAPASVTPRAVEPVSPEPAGSEPSENSDFPDHDTRAQPASIAHESISDTIEALASAADGPQPEFAFADPVRAPVAELFDADAIVASLMPTPDVYLAEAAAANGYADDQEQPAEAPDDQREQRIPPRFLRNYKIQEVIKRRQILLIQVVKEERGTKGAALTTYISLAGRFCVLMPNSPRGGGISRKITSAADRRRLKEITAELGIPKGMGLIVRTAGAQRPKPEITRDCEYLMRLWDDIREHTMRSVAPALIYEEASLIKRAIRDVYSRDVDEIQVDGEDGWRAAHDFMRMLMPSHAKKVQLWRDPNGQPLFARYQVDAQLDAMMSPTVQLKSGGYLVINQAEALVAVDVNSGRSTRERGIEETALRTNLEAADEVARQLRLRDLAGLIVIDFIDMEAKKHNAMVERRLKEALKNDRARIQVGQISHFGLLEMSRQRLRPSLAETSFVACPHCGGLGHVRSTESAAIQVLRAIEEEGTKRRSAEIVVYAATSIAMYVLNHKRDRLMAIEARYGMHVTFASDETLLPPNIRIERLRAQLPGEGPATITQDAWQNLPAPAVVEAEIEEEEVLEVVDDIAEDTAEPRLISTETAEETAESTGRKRRRRRRGGRRDESGSESPAGASASEAPQFGESYSEASQGELPQGELPQGEPAHADDAETVVVVASPVEHGSEAPVALSLDDEEAQRRRRGRRGGRRRRRDDDTMTAVGEIGAEQPDLPPVYAGPTPANPFGGRDYDIFEVLERAEEQATLPASAPVVPPEEASPVQFEAIETGPAVEEPVASVAEGLAIEPVSSVPVISVEVIAVTPPSPPMETVPETVPEIVVENAGTPVHAVELAAEPEPVIAEPVAATVVEAVAGPVIQPIVIGETDAPPAEKKRGWWRR